MKISNKITLPTAGKGFKDSRVKAPFIENYRLLNSRDLSRKCFMPFLGTLKNDKKIDSSSKILAYSGFMG